MNRGRKLLDFMLFESKYDTLAAVHKALDSATDETEKQTYHMMLAVAHLSVGDELHAKRILCMFCDLPAESAIHQEASLLHILSNEDYAGIPMTDEKRRAARALFAALDQNLPEYSGIAMLMFESEFRCGNFNAALSIAQIRLARIPSYEIVDVHFAAGQIQNLMTNLNRERGMAVDPIPIDFAMGYAWQKLRNPIRAIALFEPAVRRNYHDPQYGSKCAYRSLQKCYQMLSEERYVDGSLEDRFRVCEVCDAIIDRKPLLAEDTDFLVCGACRNVPYCSEKCHDTHWPYHKSECGKSQLPEKRIDFYALDMCLECLCSGAKLQCTRCKKARYCDAKCQKAHWKNHKKACGSQQKLGGGESL